MSNRPESNEYQPSQEKYISLVPAEGELVDLLREQTAKIYAWAAGLSESEAEHRYAPGKWSIKGVLGHLTDNERIMSYRLLAIARGEQANMPCYDEEDYAANAEFDRLSIVETLRQYKAARESTLALLDSLPESAWTRMGTVCGGPMSVRAKACLIIGHERHHIHVLRERYSSKIE
ncbi:DinB family protein [Paenibacillus sp. NFR01]|uniref:DinB family protein n=1 Tax=Paenibacillus sp. NFR01 TaxID=1566279 RepID=UPI0008AD82B8|nr:DinB family protein [Paenibacillus sp. NFR01]SET56735.1 Uncharacterized damage-inducible protein DinB (forms a four-helix bundle) [Paenibacillus sp. NFR01]